MFTNNLTPQGLLVAASAALIGLPLLTSPAQAATIGVQFIGDGRATMASDDLAGAPGVRTGNWNNLSGASLDDTAIYDDGSTIGGGFAVTPSDTSFSNRGNPSDNDEFLFNTVKDVSGTYTVVVDNIPFAVYDLYIYRRSEATDRAGGFSVDGGTTTYYLGDVPGSHAGNPDATGSGYVLSTDTTFGGGASDVDDGNYTVISGLTASDITILATAYGPTPRNKFAGFQIVEVPEPSSLALLGIGSLLIARRRRD